MEQYHKYYFAAVILSIPLTSISHFIPPLPICMQADLCNHTWIPECAQQYFYIYRMFIDECDILEYNCDYDKNFTLANYTDCFNMMISCPPMPTCKACPTCRACKLRMGDNAFDPIATVPMNERRIKSEHKHDGHEEHDHFIEHIHLHGGHRGVGTLKFTAQTALTPYRTPGPARRRRYHFVTDKGFRKASKKKKKFKFKITRAVRTKIKPRMKTKTTKQVIKTATTATYSIRTQIIIKNGKKYKKVYKYLSPRVLEETTGIIKPVETTKDSDFLEK